jgi:error-prone DNA polymerase
MTLEERLESDVLGTSVTVGSHPLRLHRSLLEERGALRAVDLEGLGDGRSVRVAGAVICRQRPGTAKGFLFLTLEDETGLVNVTVLPDLFEREHAVLVAANVLEVDGTLQAREGISVRARAVRGVDLPRVRTSSRNFH